MVRLDGKIALVTGGNSGIGLATATLHNRTARARVDCGDQGDRTQRTDVQGDMSKLADLDRLFAQIRQEKGRLDIAFANAGIAKYAPLGAVTEELFDSIFDVNVKGVLFTVQKVLALMPDGASVILNASIVASKGLPSNSV